MDPRDSKPENIILEKGGETVHMKIMQHLHLKKSNTTKSVRKINTDSCIDKKKKNRGDSE